MTGYGLDDDASEHEDEDEHEHEDDHGAPPAKPARAKSVTWADPVDDSDQQGPAWPSGGVSFSGDGGTEGDSSGGGGGGGGSSSSSRPRQAGALGAVLMTASSSSLPPTAAEAAEAAAAAAAAEKEKEDEAAKGFQIGAVHLYKKQVGVFVPS